MQSNTHMQYYILTGQLLALLLRQGRFVAAEKDERLL